MSDFSLRAVYTSAGLKSIQTLKIDAKVILIEAKMLYETNKKNTPGIRVGPGFRDRDYHNTLPDTNI